MKRILPTLLAASLLCGFAQAADETPKQPAEPKVNTKAFQDWVVRCPVAPQPLPCDAVQMLINPQTKQRVLSLSTAYDAAKSRHVVRILLPLGVWLPSGVTIVAGETKLERVAVKRCEAFGCVVEGPLDAKLLEAMRKGGEAKLVVFDQNQKPLDLKYSLAGFAEAEKYMVEETKKVRLPNVE
jgi:invasion protein IalB